MLEQIKHELEKVLATKKELEMFYQRTLGKEDVLTALLAANEGDNKKE